MIFCFEILAMMHVYGAVTVVIFIHSKEFGDDEGVEGDDGGDGGDGGDDDKNAGGARGVECLQ